jgi:hypothetical protein
MGKLLKPSDYLVIEVSEGRGEACLLVWSGQLCVGPRLFTNTTKFSAW